MSTDRVLLRYTGLEPAALPDDAEASLTTVQRGDVVEVSADYAERLDYFPGSPFALAAKGAKAMRSPLERETVEELRGHAERMGLDTDGTKADLVERLRLYPPPPGVLAETVDVDDVEPRVPETTTDDPASDGANA